MEEFTSLPWFKARQNHSVKVYVDCNTCVHYVTVDLLFLIIFWPCYRPTNYIVSLQWRNLKCKLHSFRQISLSFCDSKCIQFWCKHKFGFVFTNRWQCLQYRGKILGIYVAKRIELLHLCLTCEWTDYQNYIIWLYFVFIITYLISYMLTKYLSLLFETLTR
jgi:hypothetical protein